MHVRTRIGSALVAASLVVALAAAPVLAGGGPRFSLSPGRGASGITVTMTMKNCLDPRLFVGGTRTDNGAMAAAGTSGYVRWANPNPFAQGYLYANTWTAVGTSLTTWTTTFNASLPSGKSTIWVFCNGSAGLMSANFTVR